MMTVSIEYLLKAQQITQFMNDYKDVIEFDVMPTQQQYSLDLVYTKQARHKETGKIIKFTSNDPEFIERVMRELVMEKHDTKEMLMEEI